MSLRSSGYSSAAAADGEFALTNSSPSPSSGNNDQLLLATASEFGHTVNATNLAQDTAVNPTLVIELPPDTGLSRTVRETSS